LQLLASLSSLASFHMTEPCAYDGVPVAVPVTRDVRPRCTTRPDPRDLSSRCGLATCLGASIVTLGSAEPGVVCDIAAPVRLHSNAVDRMATAEGATRLDDILISRSPKSGHKCRPGADIAPRIQPAVPFGPASCSGAVTRILRSKPPSTSEAPMIQLPAYSAARTCAPAWLRSRSRDSRRAAAPEARLTCSR